MATPPGSRLEVLTAVAERASELRGFRMLEPQPAALRHFTARFEALG